MFLCDLLLYLFRILIIIVSVTFLLTILFILLVFSTLKDSFMLFVHLLHFLLLIDPSDFLSSAFDVFDIWCHFHVVSLLPHFYTIYLFCGELQVLIFVEPGNGLNIDVVLLERRYVFA